MSLDELFTLVKGEERMYSIHARVKAWILEHADSLSVPGIYPDKSGIELMRTSGCGCCSTYMNDAVAEQTSYDDFRDYINWLDDKKQKELVFIWLHKLIQQYGLDAWFLEHYEEQLEADRIAARDDNDDEPRYNEGFD